jgi:DNA polymerase III alpha subunit
LDISLLCSAGRAGGLIQQYKEHISKKGDRMAFTVLEDMSSSVEVIVFPETFARCCGLQAVFILVPCPVPVTQ